jgi:hypothetical protein
LVKRTLTRPTPSPPPFSFVQEGKSGDPDDILEFHPFDVCRPGQKNRIVLFLVAVQCAGGGGVRKQSVSVGRCASDAPYARPAVSVTQADESGLLDEPLTKTVEAFLTAHGANDWGHMMVCVCVFTAARPCIPAV